MDLNLITIEYFDRQNNCVCIDTFISCEKVKMKNGMSFVAIGERSPKEGRVNSDGYKLPLLMVYQSESSTHIISKGYGSHAKDLCYTDYDEFLIELK